MVDIEVISLTFLSRLIHSLAICHLNHCFPCLWLINWVTLDVRLGRAFPNAFTVCSLVQYPCVIYAKIQCHGKGDDGIQYCLTAVLGQMLSGVS